jgi:hypothetical protein
VGSLNSAGGTGGGVGSAGTGGQATAGSGGNAGASGGSTTAGNGGSAGASGGGKAGTGSAGTGTAGAGGLDAGTGGDAGSPGGGAPLEGGAIVVATTVGSQSFLVLLDPKNGSQLAQTPIEATIHAVVYEAARDKWFVFAGPAGKNVSGDLLVGSVDTLGFHTEQTVTTIPMPTDQFTVATLDRRILYRSATRAGAMPNVDDQLTLLDTSAVPIAIGTMTIDYAQSVISMAGRPASGNLAGGRVFMLHANSGVLGNCSPEDGGAVPQDSCSFGYSSLQILATDQGTLTAPIPVVVGVEDQNGSQPALAVQPGSNGTLAAIVAPPLSSTNTAPTGEVYLYNAGTGARTADPALPFPMGMVASVTSSLAIAGAQIDPCRNVAMTGELANTKRLYAVALVPGGTTSSILPDSKNGTVGQLIFEPYTGTLIHSVNDPTNPTFGAYELHGQETAPVLRQRGKAGAAPWTPPAGLVPRIVAVKMPDNAPCPNLP